jgi:hypothetical protein
MGISVDRPPGADTHDPPLPAPLQNSVRKERASIQPPATQNQKPVRPPEPFPAAQKPPEPQTLQQEQNQGVAAIRPKPQQPGAAYAKAQTLRDGRLRIQALVWSSSAADRMAVINSHIVHEGEKVDGFTILSIREDDVVVEEKGTQYRVPFGRP